MEADRLGAVGQMMLDGIFQKVSVLKEFTKEHLLDEIAKFVACNDQVCHNPSLMSYTKFFPVSHSPSPIMSLFKTASW